MDRRAAFDEHSDIREPAQQSQCSKHRRADSQRVDQIDMPEFAFGAGFFFVASDFEFNPEPDDEKDCDNDGRHRHRRIRNVVRGHADGKEREAETAQPFIDPRMMPVDDAETSTSRGIAAGSSRCE